jgi:hypothetical protein
MRAYRLWAVVAIVAGLATLPGRVWAQSDTGSIDGRVFDESRAPIPGATVTARNTATGLTRTAITSASGTYHFSSLPAGSYDITSELAGFSTQIQKGIDVQVASTTPVDFTLKVATVAETITVTGEAKLIQTTTSDIGQVITSKMVENIPLNGRKFQDLSLLVPGTRQSNYYDPTKTEVGGISYGGMTGRSVIINVDGGDNNDGVVRGLLQQFTADAIQEYKVTTQRYSAEFGRSVGGVVNVITKSGTNEFHGTGFVFARDQRLNSLNFFQKKQAPDRRVKGLPEKPPFKQQQFGGTLGGPIEKDKSHFFVAYERNRRDDFATVDTGGVLRGEEGDFAQPFRNHLLTTKLDFALGPNNNLIARYSLEDQKRDHDFIGGNTLKTAGATNTNKIHSGILKNTTVLGHNKLNEFLVLFQRFENNILAEDNTNPGIQTPDFFFGANGNTPQQTIQKRFQAREDFSFRKEGWGGDHDFKVGAEVLRSHYGGFFTPNLYGIFNFATAPKGCANPCTNLNAYLNGIADTFSGSAGDNAFDDNWTYVAGYLQDDYKPSPRLTFNLGVRYEIQYGPYTNRFDTVTIRDLKARGFNTQRKQDYKDVSPRVGFAWDVNGDAKAVIRGGIGRYYDEIFQNITLYEYWSQVASPTFFVSVSPATFTPNVYKAGRDSIRRGFVDPTFAGQLVRLTSPDLRQPYNDQANFGVSVQPTPHLGFDVDYVHGSGKQEIHRWDVDTPENLSTRVSPVGRYNPTFGRVVVEGNRGHSKYDAVYVVAKARTSKLQWLSTYAWTKARNIANDFNSRPSIITNLSYENDFNWTPNDIRHRVTTGAVISLPLGFQYSTGFQWNTGKPFNALAGLGGRRNAVRAVNPATGQMFPRNECIIGGVDKCRAANFLSWDMRLSKIFRFGRDKSFEVLGEVFNVTDHVNYDRDQYVSRFTSANFGQPTSVIKNSQRQAELGVRFRF